MECKEFLLRISDYIDGTLSPEEQTKLEEHLSICPQCRTFANTLKTTITLCQSLCEVPTAIHQSLHHFLRHEWEIQRVQVSIGISKFPFIDLVEKKKQIIVLIELPGVKRKDITLEVSPEYIEISGFNEKIEGVYYMSEINYYSFSRKIKLPGLVDTSKVQTKLRNGILKLTLPRA